MSQQSKALRYLVRAKFKGVLRRQLARLKTWKGALFAFGGLALVGLWLVGLFIGGFASREDVSVEFLEMPVRMAIMMFSLLSLGGAFQHRGLYLPAEEIERLFAAPVSRGDLIRYRLGVNGARAIPGTLLIGYFAVRWLPDKAWGFLAVAILFQTLPVANQLFAILLGKLEASRAKLAAKFARPLLFLFVPVAAGFGYFSVAGAEGLEIFQGVGDMSELLEHPILGWLTLPAIPYWKVMTGPTLAVRLPWLLVCIGILVTFVQVTVRLPVDFRELSLETSASVAQRIRRLRSGGSIWMRVNKRSKDSSRGLPLAMGPITAIMSRKFLAIARKSQGALLMGFVVLGFVLFLAHTLDKGEQFGSLGPAAIVAGVGVLYLGSAMRFDFRDELPRMAQVLSWPLSSRRIFLATVLPQSLLVSGLLALAILFQATFLTSFSVGVFAVIAILPMFVFNWSALDNSVWLIAPIRTLPGQEGALVHAGRSLLIVLLRGILSIPMALAFALVVFGGRALVEAGHLGHDAAIVLGCLTFGALLAALDVAWIYVGGFCLGRFDLARDRG